MFRRKYIQSTLQCAAIAFLTILFLSCASTVPFARRDSRSRPLIFEFHHIRSEKTSDCLAACTQMVLEYYDMAYAFPESSTLPLSLIELSECLNTTSPKSESGPVLFSAVLELSEQDIAAQIEKRRPLIVVFATSADVQYHSVVISGIDTDRRQFFVNDPAKRRPHWISARRLPTYGENGKYLTLLIGVQKDE